MKHILKEGEISLLLPESGFGGISKQVHLVRHNRKKYVLRKCRTRQDAKNIIEIHKKLDKFGFLPKLLDHRGRFLLFQFIPGRDCRTTDDSKVAYEVGKIAGQTNKYKIHRENFKHEKFYSNLKFLSRKKIITRKELFRAKGMYENLILRYVPKLRLEVCDISPSNFRIYRNRIYLVDMDAIKVSFLGGGIAKGFLKWFKNAKQRKEFKEGYHSVRDVSFLNSDYLQMSYLYFLVKNISGKYRRRMDYKKELKRFKLFLEGKLK